MLNSVSTLATWKARSRQASPQTLSPSRTWARSRAGRGAARISSVTQCPVPADLLLTQGQLDRQAASADPEAIISDPQALSVTGIIGYVVWVADTCGTDDGLLTGRASLSVPA